MALYAPRDLHAVVIIKAEIVNFAVVVTKYTNAMTPPQATLWQLDKRKQTKK